MNRKPKIFLQHASIALVLMLGFIGYSMIIPITTPMIMSKNPAILPIELGDSIRYLYIGLLLSAYPLGQLIGAPILGRLSDRYGRRKTLIASLLPVVPSYFLAAFGVISESLLLIFIGRFLTGLFSGDIVIASASMADLSDSYEQKTKNFGMLIIWSNIGFIIGPFIGGLLINPELISWFNYATPFWFSGFISFLVLAFVLFFFSETKRETSLLEKPIQKGVKIGKILTGNFFLYLANAFFFSFLPLFLLKKFSFTPPLIAFAEGYTSIPFCIAPFFYRIIAQNRTPKQLTMMAALLFFGSIGFVILTNQKEALYLTLVPPGLFIAIGSTFGAIMVSDAVSKDQQGQALGKNQSCFVLSEIFAGLIGGATANYSYYIPQFFGMIFAFLSAGWIFFFVKRTIRKDL